MSEFAADGVSPQIAATQTHPASLWRTCLYRSTLGRLLGTNLEVDNPGSPLYEPDESLVARCGNVLMCEGSGDAPGGRTLVSPPINTGLTILLNQIEDL